MTMSPDSILGESNRSSTPAERRVPIPRTPVSIICVSNNARVLKDCLERSVEAQRLEAPDTELIVIDNSTQQFSTAGAALNHGARQAQREVCVFVHQDVYLHSMVKVEEAAGALAADPGIGLLGPVGVTPDGKILGRMRDRVLFLGRDLGGFTDVDSIDEFLLMTRRLQVLEHPLSEDPDLAWHAYAVEYGARVKRAGKRVVAARVPVTHNSLSVNLARLSAGHAKVASDYPEQLPIATTCGIIGARSPRSPSFLAAHRWRYRWLRGSRHAFGMSRLLGRPAVVLSDIRVDIDRVLEEVGETKLAVGALAPGGADDGAYTQEITLERNGREFGFRALDASELLQWSARCRAEGESMLITNFNEEFLARLTEQRGDGARLLGYHDPIGFWLLQGPAAEAAIDSWQLPKARPLGLRKVPRRR